MAADPGGPPFSFHPKATSFETLKERMSQFESKVSVCLAMYLPFPSQFKLSYLVEGQAPLGVKIFN